MKRFPHLTILLFWLLAFSVSSQELTSRITNKDVIEMTSIGLSDDVIIEKIHSASAGTTLKFDMSLAGLKELKAAKVSDQVIKVMINPTPPQSPVVIGASAVVSNDPNLPPPEVGVYWKNGHVFVLIEGQAVSNSKVGGKTGSFFTYGMRNEHWDATLDGPQSSQVVNDRQPTFYIYVPEGSSAADYSLIKLEKKGDHREFEVGSFGGLTGGKAGLKRDKQVDFTAEHAGIRVYKITLTQGMKPGEYAFFMGTGQQATMSGGSGGTARSGGSAAGRVYDFRVPE
jgi:hypothetical protein